MSRTQVLYLADRALVALILRRGVPVARRDFDTEALAQPALLHYLKAHRHLSTQVVADLADESFEWHRVAAPRPSDREALARRALQQRYPETPFRFTRLGSRHRALLAAVARPAALSRLVEALDSVGAPLVAVHSAAILGSRLVEGLGLGATASLLASPVPGGQLRLSAFEAGELIFSRVAPVPAGEGVRARGRAVAEELRRTWNYLVESGTLAGPSTALHTIVLAHSGDRAEWAAALADAGGLHCHVADTREVARRLGLSTRAGDSAADELFAAMVVRHRLPNHYAPAAALRHALYRRARRVIIGASTITALAGVAVAAINLSIARDARWQEAGALAAAHRIAAERDALVAAMPALPASPDVLHELAALQTGALEGRAGPIELLTRLSHVLSQFPEARLTQLAWHTTEDPGAAPALPHSTTEAAGALRSTAPTPAATRRDATTGKPGAWLPTGRLAVAMLEGVMPSGLGDVEGSLRHVAELAAAISSLPGLQAEVVSGPIDPTPRAKLEGRFAAGVPKPGPGRFTLKVTARHGGSA